MTDGITALCSILFWLGMAALLVSNVAFSVIAFRYSLAWFFGCLFIPFAPLFYFLAYPKQTWKPMLIAAAGILAMGLGYGLLRFCTA